MDTAYQGIILNVIGAVAGGMAVLARYNLWNEIANVATIMCVLNYKLYQTLYLRKFALPY